MLLGSCDAPNSIAKGRQHVYGTYCHSLQVACGSRHTLFLSESHCVWAAGDNGKGQLGLGKKLPGNQALARRVQALVGGSLPFHCR